MTRAASTAISSLIVKIASETRSSDNDRALHMVRSLNRHLDQNGTPIEDVVLTAVNPRLKLGKMPGTPLNDRSRRDWVRFLLARDDMLSQKEDDFLRAIIVQRYPTTHAQNRWLFDILARIEPCGCGKWGSPT